MPGCQISCTSPTGPGRKIHHRKLTRARQRRESPDALVHKALDAHAKGLVTDFGWKTVPRRLCYLAGPLWFAPMNQNQLFAAPLFPGAVLLPVPPARKLPADSPQWAAQKGRSVRNPVKRVMKFLSLTVQWFFTFFAHKG